MAYVPWSVVFGEVPSASKWNILGTNDSSFNDGTGIGTSVLSNTNMADRTRRQVLLVAGDSGVSFNEGSPEVLWTGATPSFARASGIVPLDYAAGTSVKLIIMVRSDSANNQQLNYFVGVHKDGAAFTSWNDQLNQLSSAIGVSANTNKEILMRTIPSGGNLAAGCQISFAAKPNTAVTGNMYMTAAFLEYTADM